MGFFSDLLKWFKPFEIEDDFFGRLVYMNVPNGRTSYWEAKRSFAPISADIELFIDAPGPRLSPNEQQRAFFDWVVRDYATILANLELTMPSAIEKKVRQPLIAPFADAFHLTSVSIPLPSEDAPPRWEMSFESNASPVFLLQVELIGADPLPDISIDFC